MRKWMVVIQTPGEVGSYVDWVYAEDQQDVARRLTEDTRFQPGETLYVMRSECATAFFCETTHQPVEVRETAAQS